MAKKEVKKEASESWETKYKSVVKALKEAFGDKSLHPELYWTLELRTRPGKNGVERQMTTNGLSMDDESEVTYVPEEEFQAWLFSEQERILLLEKSQFDVKIARLDTYVQATIAEEAKYKRNGVRNNVDRGEARASLEKLWKDRDRYKDRKDPHSILMVTELDKRIAVERASIAAIDASTTSPDRYASDSDGAIIIDWYPDVSTFNIAGSQRKINIVAARKAAELEKNELLATELPKLKDKISATTGAKDYWMSRAKDRWNSLND